MDRQIIMFNSLPGLDIPALLLLTGLAFFVEKHHTNRWTIAANCVILLTAFGIDSLFETSILSLYVIGSVVAAIITVISYVKGFPLFGSLYKALHLFYSSKTVLGVVIATMFNALSIAFIPIIIIWAIAIRYFGHPMPI